jgi:uncharacterized protein (TIGR03083 family)
MSTEISDWLDAVRSNSGLLARAARTAGLEAAVPTTPGWTVADLIQHTGVRHRWVTEIIETKAQERVGRAEIPGPGQGDDAVAWFEAGAAGLLSTLEAADPDTPVWTWSSAEPVPARFWFRRVAHETVIHRVDAESAAGDVGPIEPAALAADGIDELLELVTVRTEGDDPGGLSGSFHFHTTDVAGEWVVVFAGGAMTVRREHAKADVAVRGAASDLELFLYNRRGADGLDVFGDPALVAAWAEHVRF